MQILWEKLLKVIDDASVSLETLTGIYKMNLQLYISYHDIETKLKKI